MFLPCSLKNRGLPKGWFSKRVVLADVPPERKPERGYIQMFPRNQNRNEGTFERFPRNENRNEGTFAKTTLLRNRPLISQLKKYRCSYLATHFFVTHQAFAQAKTALWAPFSPKNQLVWVPFVASFPRK